MAISEVITVLENIKAIHEKKNKDYSAKDKPFENFEMKNVGVSKTKYGWKVDGAGSGWNEVKKVCSGLSMYDVT